MPPLAPRTSVLDDIGNPDAEPGSLPWARWFVFRAKKRREDLESDATALRELIEKLDRHEAWRPLNYPSLGMLCQLEIGLTEEEMDGLKAARPGESVGVVLRRSAQDRAETPLPLNPHGVKEDSRCRGSDTTSAPINKRRDADYLTARIARDHPEILDRMKRGEFQSVRAAARAAGIVRPTIQVVIDHPRDTARQLARHFDTVQLADLMDAINEILKARA